MFSILLLVYLFHTLSLVAPLPVHLAATASERFERDLATCECPSEQRTVWAILWSCLATIFTCTWVSVHPNIPDPNDSTWKVAKRRAGLMIWTILAPELVVFWAIRQWIGARQLADKYHGFGWTKTHGYFLQMGGFTLYEEETRKYVLSGYTLQDLFCGGKIIFPTITEEEIQDRSKGDGLTKAIAIFQTTWFIIQCIARHVQGLAVTELEIITLAFATLNGLIYVFWWNKPLDVRYSVPVLLLQEPRACQTLKESKLRTLSYYITYDMLPGGSFWGGIPKLIHHLWLVCWQACARNFNALRSREFRWSWKAILTFPSDLLRDSLVGPVGEFCGEERFKNTTNSRRYTRYAEVIDSHTIGYKLGILVVVVGNLFGAIHCTAWSSSFPSDAERIIWRVCSLLLLPMPEILLLVFAVADLELYHYIPKSLRRALKVPALVLAAITMPVYGVARVILIIEAFIALRALTPAALAEVKWTSFIPHI